MRDVARRMPALVLCLACAGGCVDLNPSDGVTLRGDVLVTTQAEADALAGVTRIAGCLTVRPSEPVVQLPFLQQVSGDVLIEVEDTTTEMFSAAEIADLPQLATIGGTLRFYHLDGNYGSDVQLGLPALTSLPHELELTLSSFNGYNKGLDALQQVQGDVVITGRGDFYAFDLLENLTQVAGNVTVQTTGAGSSGGILPGLVQVDGDLELLSLRRIVGANSLAALQTVGATMRLNNAYAADSAFPALTDVAGGLILEADGAAELPASVVLGSTTDLSLASLTVTDTGLSALPFAPATRVDATGAISIHDNADLCQSSVEDFVTTQQMAGWIGALTVANNTGACPP